MKHHLYADRLESMWGSSCLLLVFFSRSSLILFFKHDRSGILLLLAHFVILHQYYRCRSLSKVKTKVKILSSWGKKKNNQSNHHQYFHGYSSILGFLLLTLLLCYYYHHSKILDALSSLFSGCFKKKKKQAKICYN
jgi:hypothetical protein